MPDNTNGSSKKIKAAVLIAAGHSQAEVAKELGISTRTLQRWMKEDGFDTLKNNVASEVIHTTVKATAEHLSEGANPVFSYREKKNLILKECEYLDLALASPKSRTAVTESCSFSVVFPSTREISRIAISFFGSISLSGFNRTVQPLKLAKSVILLNAIAWSCSTVNFDKSSFWFIIFK